MYHVRKAIHKKGGGQPVEEIPRGESLSIMRGNQRTLSSLASQPCFYSSEAYFVCGGREGLPPARLIVIRGRSRGGVGGGGAHASFQKMKVLSWVTFHALSATRLLKTCV